MCPLLLPVAVAVDTHPQTSNVSINDEFSLSCTASAFPLPNITWFQNSTLVENDTRTTIAQTTTSRTVTSTITIDNATTSDGGTYVCRVDAPPGTDFNITDSDTALVLVQGESHVLSVAKCVFFVWLKQSVLLTFCA